MLNTLFKKIRSTFFRSAAQSAPKAEHIFTPVLRAVSQSRGQLVAVPKQHSLNAKQVHSLFTWLGYAVSPAKYCNGFLIQKNGDTALVCLALNPTNSARRKGLGENDIKAASEIAKLEGIGQILLATGGSYHQNAVKQARGVGMVLLDGISLTRMLMAHRPQGAVAATGAKVYAC
ncbi:hypothetical protein OPS25_13870 [Alteromonas ponticola]|uniref:Restriction endonuclease type IV Mrr domain-containing protein n=1 Tax=Alteromonas aquimaris TaxID=2998417 RepID=A0ABT3P9Y8_9ALTE|nr:hypothetical protein [Alteromonas aquimaris]MCW8109592.1 hypothetical protein [Alteromonas aquimaris]